MSLRALFALLLLAGCEPVPVDDDDTTSVGDDDDATGDDDDATGDDDDATSDDDDSGSDECSPALSVEPGAAQAPPLGLVVFVASGGTGEYRFDLTDNASGAIINELTGSYVGGHDIGAVDTITLTDLGCDGSATATAEIVDPFGLVPGVIQVLPGTSFQFTTVGGTGDVSCEVVVAGAGGSADGDCTYTAPTTSGLDVVEATDLGTGDTVIAEVEVTPDAALSPPAPVLAVPVGGSVWPVIAGGSGHLDDPVVTGTSATWTDGQIDVTEAGATTIELEDTYAGLSTTLTVLGVESPAPTLDRFGNQEIGWLARGPGDVTGDGIPDALLAIQEADVGGFNAGAVFLYAGTATGLDPTPTQTWAGTTWDEELGRGLALADFDGDGIQDLALGAPRADLAASDVGKVAIHPGDGAGFSEAPALEVWGDNGGDRFGHSIAACDFDGDGYDDLAVGAIRTEDRLAAEQATNQGGLYIFLGGPDGLAEQPAQTRYGVLPEADAWTYAADAFLGEAMAAGDVDGDGFCDLAVGAYEQVTGPGAGTDGALWLYYGTGPEGLLPGGLEPEPAALWLADPDESPSSQFARSLAVGDLDGDGQAEVLVAMRSYDGPDGSNPGAVFLLEGGDHRGDAEAQLAEDLPALMIGDTNFDALGELVSIADVDDDGLLDAIVTGSSDEVTDGVTNAGAVHIWFGDGATLPSGPPGESIGGLVNGDFFGVAAAPLGDVDGDGTADLLALAARDATLGWNAGRPYFVSRGAGALTPLDLPGPALGQRLGSGVALVGDVDGDGSDDLAVGAFEDTYADNRPSAGSVFLWSGDLDGEPVHTLREFPGHSGNDDFGFDLSPAGDFNGDGIPDLAAVAEADDRPNTFDDALYANPDACPGTETNLGAVHIFLGSADGSAPAHSFVAYGPAGQPGIRALDGGGDLNGDGFDDLLFGVDDFDGAETNSGAVGVFWGRAADPAGSTVICAADWLLEGPVDDARLGRDVAVLGDLDGDGCDEFAAGADEEDTGGTDRGAVHVYRGFGAACAVQDPQRRVLTVAQNNARFGWSLDGGHDADGDGVPDLAVGAYGWDGLPGANVGAAWLVPGSYLEGLPTEEASASQGVFFDATPTPDWIVEGDAAGDQLGRGVALVPGVHPDGRAALLAGGDRSGMAGTLDSGGARLHLVALDTQGDAVGLDAAWMVFVGESWAVDSRLGERVSGGTLDGQATAIVSGHRADGVGVDVGAAYVIPVPSP